MRIWAIEIGETLPVRGDERLLRYGIVLPLLADRGHEVTWWTSGFIHSTLTHLSKKDLTLHFRGVRIEALKGIGYPRSTSPRRLAHHWEFAHRLRDRVQREREHPDVVLCSSPTPDNLRTATEFARTHSCGLVVDVRDDWPRDLVRAIPGPLRPMARPLLAPYSAWTSRAFRAADVLVASSARQLQYGYTLSSRTPVADDRVIYHPYVEPALESDHGSVMGAGQAIDPLRLARLVFVGTLGQHFELDTVLEAFAEARIAGVELVIVGDGTERARLEALTRRLGLSERVVMTGWLERDALNDVLRSSDVGLAPYRYIAGVGNKFAEYFAHGLPVVTNLDGEVGSLLRRYDCGLTYSSGDRPSLVAALRTMFGSDRRTKAANARRAYRELFSETVVADQFETVLAQASDRSSHRGT